MKIYQIVPEKNPKFDGNLPNNSGEENVEESMMLLKKNSQVYLKLKESEGIFEKGNLSNK